MSTSERSRVRRLPDRAAYDAETIHAILDAAPVGHVGFVAGRSAGRDPDAVRPRRRRHLPPRLGGQPAAALDGAIGLDVCLTVTLVDGLVLARSAFHHSMNYRSAVLFGRAEAGAPATEKERALRAISEHLIAGRWDEVRPPTPLELRQTSVAQADRRGGVGQGPPRRSGRRRGGPRARRCGPACCRARRRGASRCPTRCCPPGTPPSPSVTALRDAG